MIHNIGFMKTMVQGVLVTLLGLMACSSALASDLVEYTVNYWVEKPEIFGDPGDPTFNKADVENFMLFKQEMRRGSVGETITMTQEEAGMYLRTEEKSRRFASFISSGEIELQAQGVNEIDVYYTRDMITYEFDLVNVSAQMTIGGITYYGSRDEKYSFRAKYGQAVIVPGIENGLMPTTNDLTQVSNGVYCAGWSLDTRTGDTQLLAYTKTITESMLPTDDMPYEDVVFTLGGTWFGASEASKLVAWYEQMPEEVGKERNRMTYNGKVYVNYPESDYECVLPKGAKPDMGGANGLIYRGSIDPDPTKEGVAGRTWQFIYDRDCYTITFNTGGAGSIAQGQGVMYQQNLHAFDPGWNEDTTRTEGTDVYRFIGWYTESGEFITFNLSEIYMPARNIRLNARWEKMG